MGCRVAMQRDNPRAAKGLRRKGPEMDCRAGEGGLQRNPSVSASRTTDGGTTTQRRQVKPNSRRAKGMGHQDSFHFTIRFTDSFQTLGREMKEMNPPTSLPIRRLACAPEGVAAGMPSQAAGPRFFAINPIFCPSFIFLAEVAPGLRTGDRAVYEPPASAVILRG